MVSWLAHTVTANINIQSFILFGQKTGDAFVIFVVATKKITYDGRVKNKENVTIYSTKFDTKQKKRSSIT